MTTNRVGIRREDKNAWERRAPLTPSDVAVLSSTTGLDVVVQPSPRRVFGPEEYLAAGAAIEEDLSGCDLVLAVKEIPEPVFRRGAAYAFFSHTIKGQEHNMPLLRAILERGSTLLDYERVVDAHGRRVIPFGRYAGIAGAIDALWAYGRRLLTLGIDSPFADLGPAWSYPDLSTAYGAVAAVGRRIGDEGLPAQVAPLVVGVTGYGNVASGVQEVLGHLPVTDVPVDRLPLVGPSGEAGRTVHRVVFREEDTVSPPVGSDFDLDAYRRDPSGYRSTFARHLPYLSILVNGIYWDQRGPRLVGRADLARLGMYPRLQVIADLSCDIDGGIESTVRATTPDAPTYVYDPRTGDDADGVDGDGIVVLAVDNLPCEVPRDASAGFSAALRPFVPALAACDWAAPLDRLALPPEWRGAVIAHDGRLAPAYDYLEDPLARHG